MRRLHLDDRAGLASIIDVDAFSSAVETFGIALTTEAVGADAVLTIGDGVTEGPTVRLQPSWRRGMWRVSEDRRDGDGRPERIFRRFGSTLDPETIHAAAAALPDGFGPGRSDPAGGWPGPPPVCGDSPSRDAARRWLASDLLFNLAPAEPEALAWLVADALAAVTRKAPRVSIVINTYNYADFLPAAIESALDQEIAAQEVIVVDDGSTDGSREIVARYPGVRALFKENGGQGSAFNAGFAAATGDLILFLDADDRLLPDVVAELSTQCLDGVSRLSFGLETIDGEGVPTGLFRMSRASQSGELKGPLLNDGFLLMMPTSGNAFPRATLERLLPMPEPPWRISADVYLAFGAAFLGATRHLDRVLGQYRVHGRNAYHATFGSEAPFSPRKIGQRRRAFADLAERFEPESRRDAATLRTMADGRPETERADDPDHAADIPWRPLETPPLARGDAPVDLDESLSRHLREPDPARFGASATWPELRPGVTLDLTGALPDTPLGEGWSRREAPGATIRRDWATLALRFPGPRADWELTLRHAETSAAEIGLWINGMRHEPLLISPRGETAIRIAAGLLDPDPATRSWRAGITLVPAPGADLTVSALTPRRVLPAVTGAPVLRAGAAVRPGDPTGRRVLAAGWHWPDAESATMAAAEAGLRFSVAERGDLSLQIVADPLPMLVSLDGRALTMAEDAAGRGCHVAIPSGAIPYTGLVDLSLVAIGAGTRPRLSGLRLTKPAASLPAGHFVPAEDLDIRQCGDGALTVTLPDPVAEPLVLRFETADAEQRRVEAELPGGTVTLLLGGPATVTLIPGAPIRQLGLRLAEGVTLTDLAREAGWPSPLPDAARAQLDAPALAACATDPGRWGAAGDEALWLTSNRGAIRLVRPAAEASLLRVGVLALSGHGQTLSLGLGDRTALTGPADGLQTLSLDLPPGEPGEVLTLEVETDLLVDGRLLGVDGTGVLGGALVRAAFETAPAASAQARSGAGRS